MTESKLVALLLEALGDLERVTAGVTTEDAALRRDGGSSFGWTVAHVVGQLDLWINGRVRGEDRNPAFEDQERRFGRGGDSDDWDAVRAAVDEVRANVSAYLEPLGDDDLESVEVPPTGRYPAVPLRYIVYRMIAHLYFHIGEITSKRSALGQDVGDYPGPLVSAM